MMCGSAATAELPIGYILSLEGADSMITRAHLERSFARWTAGDRTGALRAGRLCRAQTRSGGGLRDASLLGRSSASA